MPMALIREKINLSTKGKTKKKKNYVGFCIPKVGQIMKRFAGIFHRAQTLKLWGAILLKDKEDFLTCLEYEYHSLLEYNIPGLFIQNFYSSTSGFRSIA